MPKRRSQETSPTKKRESGKEPSWKKKFVIYLLEWMTEWCKCSERDAVHGVLSRSDREIWLMGQNVRWMDARWSLMGSAMKLMR